MFTKTPRSLAELVTEFTISRICESPYTLRWSIQDNNLVAPRYDANLAEFLASGRKFLPELLAHDIIAGLNVMHHRGFIHCDIKPQNILVETRGKYARAVLGDFGISQAYTGNGRSNAYTIPYRPPEIDYDGNAAPAEITPYCDMYAAGLLLYVLKYRRIPHFDHREFGSTSCTCKYILRIYFGEKHTCNGAFPRACSLPIEYLNMGKEEIRDRFSLDTEKYDDLILDLIRPRWQDRIDSTEALMRIQQILHEVAPEIPLSAPLPVVSADISPMYYADSILHNYELVDENVDDTDRKVAEYIAEVVIDGWTKKYLRDSWKRNLHNIFASGAAVNGWI